jgi:hypothetical protein
MKINIDNFNKILNSFSRTDKNFNHTIFPYKCEIITNRMHVNECDSPQEFLRKKDKDFYEVIKKYKATSESAIFCIQKPSEPMPYFVNTQSFDKLNSFLIPDEDGKWLYNNLVFIGPKGSGKTSMQDFWLIQNHKILEEQKILYLRCDAQKLYSTFDDILTYRRAVGHIDVLNPYEKVTQHPTIQDYIDFQLLVVLANKKNADGLPNKIMNHLEINKNTFLFEKSIDFEGKNPTQEPIYTFIDSHVSQQIEKDKDYISTTMFKNSGTKRKEWNRWKECANSVKDVLKRMDVRLMLILDGVDNLHLNTEAGIRVYQLLLPELRSFILRKGASNELRLAVMRERTWIDVNDDEPSISGSDKSVEPKAIKHTPPNSKDVMEKRIDWLHDILIKTINNNITKTSCINTLIAAIEKIPKSEILHDNIRNIIVNSATLAEHTRFRWFQLGIHTDLNLSKQASQLMKRNLFLNGEFYLKTQDTFKTNKNRDKGYPYINPFWTDENKFPQSKEKPSNLLLRIRMLELLASDTLTHSKLLEYLKDGFGYDKIIVDQVVKDARAFGWIDSAIDETEEKDVALVLSSTGRYLLDDLLSDVDVLYMLALDTLIPKYFLEKGFFPVHSNDIERSGYIGCMAVTIVSFLHWLCINCRHDERFLNKEKIGETYDQIFLTQNYIELIARELGDKLSSAHEDDLEIFKSAYGILCYP